MQMPFKRTSIDGPEAEITAQQLQDVLADLVDLTLQSKQAHWNTVGRSFRSLHLQLDQVVEHARSFSDTVAERIVTLGQPAQGSLASSAAQSKLDSLPTHFIRDEDVLKLFVERLDVVCHRIRSHIESMRDRDPVSEDLLVTILGTLEEQMWMFHAQTQ